MSRLIAIIDAYRDAHGQPSEASVARAIGLSPQAVSSWRSRGIKRPPDLDAMRKLAALAGVDYETVVLRAALLDSGWIEDRRGGGGDGEEEGPEEAAPIVG